MKTTRHGRARILVDRDQLAEDLDALSKGEAVRRGDQQLPQRGRAFRAVPTSTNIGLPCSRIFVSLVVSA